MKLSDWAKKQGLNYQTAYRWYKAGKLPVLAYQADTGTIIITEDLSNKKENSMKLTTSPTHSALRKELDSLYSILNPYSFTNNLFDNLYDKDSQKFKWFNKPDKYVLGCVLPGYSEEDVKINVKGDILTVSAKMEKVDEDNLFFKDNQASFQCSWTLPSDAACSDIYANFKNGILYLTVPKLKATSKDEIAIPINKK